MAIDLLSMTFEELAAWVKEQGEAAFRAKQLYGWLQKGTDFDEMSNLSKPFREMLKEKAEKQYSYHCPGDGLCCQ